MILIILHDFDRCFIVEETIYEWEISKHDSRKFFLET